jgi:hypothetical protein
VYPAAAVIFLQAAGIQQSQTSKTQTELPLRLTPKADALGQIHQPFNLKTYK